MPKVADLTIKNNVLHLSGELDFSNVTSIYEKSLVLFNQSPTLLIDCAGLSSSNSAGLALMIEWVKLAQGLHKTLRFKHLSPKLLSIAKASDLDRFLLND